MWITLYARGDLESAEIYVREGLEEYDTLRVPFGLVLAASLLAGYGMTGSKIRSRFHMFGFALVMAVAVFVILDIEDPRQGLVRVDAFDQALVELRESMK